MIHVTLFSAEKRAYAGQKGGQNMTKEENLAYRRECPYDAMGDYSVFLENDKLDGETQKTGIFLPDISIKQTK